MLGLLEAGAILGYWTRKWTRKLAAGTSEAIYHGMPARQIGKTLG